MKLSRLPPGFGLDTAAQGLALRQEAVQNVRREWTDAGWRAQGTVTENGVAYEASVELLPPPEQQLRASSCTCGRYRCRHVAALVLATDPPDGPRPAVTPAASTPRPRKPWTPAPSSGWLASGRRDAVPREGGSSNCATCCACCRRPTARPRPGGWRCG
ncbi:SWIM zinc finger family protein [Deinococcus radiopugnans]|uniref:SWIM zinc finger family protein n=1 Tax=Deinococcus radiopugnans TaxID=57497 RepID=UPI001FDEB7F9|nr:SWIM zinc finger family protein [Deinococcus radiopugnans]